MTLSNANFETKKAEKIIDILVKEKDTFVYKNQTLYSENCSEDKRNLNDFLALYPDSDKEEAIDTLIQGEKISFKGIEFFFIPNVSDGFSLVTSETLDAEEIRKFRTDFFLSNLFDDLVENYKEENYLSHVVIAGVKPSDDGFFYTEIDHLA